MDGEALTTEYPKFMAAPPGNTLLYPDPCTRALLGYSPK